MTTYAQRIRVIYTHTFDNACGETISTHFKLDKIDAIEADHTRTKASVYMAGRRDPIVIYCTPATLDQLISACEGK